MLTLILPTGSPDSLAIFGAAAVVWFVALKVMLWKRLTAPRVDKHTQEKAGDAALLENIEKYKAGLKGEAPAPKKSEEEEEAPPIGTAFEDGLWDLIQDKARVEFEFELKDKELTIGGKKWAVKKAKVSVKAEPERQTTLDEALPKAEAPVPAPAKAEAKEADKETGEADLSAPGSKVLDFDVRDLTEGGT